MRRSRLAAVAAVIGGVSMFVVASGGVAGAQQVCEPTSFGGGEACFYLGHFQTGPEYDVSVPLGAQLPVPNPGDCTDLPSGYGATGSVRNASPDTLYVLPEPCELAYPGVLPVAIIAPRATENIVALMSQGGPGIHAVRKCGPGLTYDPIHAGCTY